MPTLSFTHDFEYDGDRPSVAVKLAASEGGPSRLFDAVLDTGANGIYFSRDVATMIGISFTEPPTDSVLVGDQSTRLGAWSRSALLEILPLGLRFRTEICFIAGGRQPPLIGMPALEHFTVGIRHLEKRLYLGDP